MKDLKRQLTSELERERAAIDFELQRRELERSGDQPERFRIIHARPECEVETVFLRQVGSGFMHIDLDPLFDYEAPAFRYELRCTHHGATSAHFESMTPIKGAVNL